MSKVPDNLSYTKEHEWVQVLDANTIRFGITDFAQEALGDIVFVTLPAVGDDIASGESCGEVESTKSVSDIYAPVSGRVCAVNDLVETSPETINQDPYGNGWIAQVEVETSSLSGLLSADEYLAITTAS
ncbi:MAG: glycine cleavage system protein GcvH [Actinobacteria bacterium]|nr:glycine cleavage system protein GcvH [Actinomycetota bacterium]